MHKEFKGIDHEFEVNGSEIQMKHKGFQMNERLGELCVGIALCLRATSLIFGKIALRTMGPFLLMGTRFLIAFAVIGLIFNKVVRRATRKELFHSAIIGLFSVLSIGLELKGLQTTDTSVTAFIEGTIVIMVPIITCVTHRMLPDKVTVITAVCSFVGVGLLTLKGGHLGFSSGELIITVATFWFALVVIFTDKYSKTDDPAVIAIMQMLFIGIFSMIGAFFFEDIRLPSSGEEWMSILALALICSGVGFTLQPLGQKYTSPERVGVLSLLNPVTAAVLGLLFLGEHMTWNKLLGSTIILLAILVPAWMKMRQEEE